MGGLESYEILHIFHFADVPFQVQGFLNFEFCIRNSRILILIRLQFYLFYKWLIYSFQSEYLKFHSTLVAVFPFVMKSRALWTGIR